MNYVLVFSEVALADIEKHKKSGDKAVLIKIEKLLNELMVHPATGTGQPEILKHNLAGLFSRRINKKHRLVYSINEEVITVHVLSAWAHYRDKKNSVEAAMKLRSAQTSMPEPFYFSRLHLRFVRCL